MGFWNKNEEEEVKEEKPKEIKPSLKKEDLEGYSKFD